MGPQTLRSLAFILAAAGGAALGTVLAIHLFGLAFDALWAVDREVLLDHPHARQAAMAGLGALGAWGGLRVTRAAPSRLATPASAALGGIGAAALAYLAAEAWSYDLGAALGYDGVDLKSIMISAMVFGPLAALVLGVVPALGAFTVHRGIRLLVSIAIVAALSIPPALVVVTGEDALTRTRFHTGVNAVMRFEVSLPSTETLDPATASVRVETDRAPEQGFFDDRSTRRDGEWRIVQGFAWIRRPTPSRLFVLSRPGEPDLRFRVDLPAKPRPSDAFGP